MSVPQINTAIPKRRYQLGEFNITLLGEVESGDGIEYRYILAVAREPDPRPNLFVTAERAPPDEADRGRYRIRISMADGSQVLESSDRWGDIDRFADEALAVVQRVLSLEDEVPYRL